MFSYIAYVVVSFLFTFWVGRNLHRNGKIFLLEAFGNDEQKANSVNQLLLVGFYLVNFGIVCLFLSLGNHPTSDVEVFEYLATKFGVVLVILGGMHFFNMRNIANMSAKARAKLEKTAPRSLYQE
jgi:cytochrome c biogenesis protein CcdA